MNNVLVSIIIPTYDRSTYLDTAIKSVIDQSYKNIEILVIDDGSKINYAESICNNYNNCHYFYKKNEGLSSARNFGISKAKGEFIAFLDDDDFWENSKIEKQIKILLKNTSIDCVHSSVSVVNEKGELTGEYFGAAPNKIYKRSGYVFWNALGCWVVKSPTPLIRRKVFQSDLMFDESIKVGEDVDFYQRMFYRHKVYYINEILAFYREYDDKKRLSLQREKYIGIEKKMLFNFKKMEVKNPVVFYLIKVKLLNAAVKRWNEIYFNDKIIINRIDFYLRPDYLWNKYF